MTKYVRYMVPVLVEVDLDQAEVVGVQVDDEHADGPLNVFSVDQGEIPNTEARRAVDIAEAEPWPAWELGS